MAIATPERDLQIGTGEALRCATFSRQRSSGGTAVNVTINGGTEYVFSGGTRGASRLAAQCWASVAMKSRSRYAQQH
jgi:hypothetical protein